MAPYTEACPGPLALSLFAQTKDVEPVFIRNDKFSFSFSFDDGEEASSTALNGVFTSPTTAEGTVRFTLSGAGAAPCDAGELPFRVTKK